MRKVITLIMCFVIMVAGGMAAADGEYNYTYRVTASSLSVRLGAGVEYDCFYTLTAGEEVPGEVIEGGWVAVNCYGFRGYVWSGYLRDVNNTGAGRGSYLGVYYITGYNPWCSHCCGKSDGITKSGAPARVCRTVAMSGLPFGTSIYIEGLGYYVVEDRGVGPGVIDVACSSHSECCRLTGNYKVYLV